MGSKHQRHERTPSSSDDDSDSSREHKRHKKDKEKKKDKHKKHKKHKKHSGKDKKRDREQERLVKEAKKFLKKQLKSGNPEAAAAAAAAVAAAGGRGAGPSEPPAPPYEGDVDPISKDDYFLKNAEFAAWLRESRGKFFSEQSTEENRAAFDDFVAAWNGRRLAAKYYLGQVAAGGSGTAALRTSHAWGIKGAGQGLAASGAVGMAAALDEELNLKEQARVAALAERKQQRQEAKEWLEEAVPRLSGKDKALEDKRARRELAKAGADSPEHAGRGWDVMGGGGDDSFAAAKAREAARHEQRGRRQAAVQAGVAQRVAAAKAAEDEKMAAFRALLQQGPIQIAKRQ